MTKNARHLNSKNLEGLPSVWGTRFAWKPSGADVLAAVCVTFFLVAAPMYLGRVRYLPSATRAPLVNGTRSECIWPSDAERVRKAGHAGKGPTTKGGAR